MYTFGYLLAGCGSCRIGSATRVQMDHAGHVPRRDRGDVKPPRTIQLLALPGVLITHCRLELDPPSPQGPLEARSL
jgi:hypothetical protein